jgi:hypothetical protein
MQGIANMTADSGAQWSNSGTNLQRLCGFAITSGSVTEKKSQDLDLKGINALIRK